MSSTVELFSANVEENGIKGTSVRTDATDADDFIKSFSSAIFRITEQGRPEFPLWLSQAFDIIAKLKGYKSEKVHERRLLWTGDVSPYHACLVESNTDAHGDEYPDEPFTDSQRLLSEAYKFVRGGPNFQLECELAYAIGIDPEPSIGPGQDGKTIVTSTPHRSPDGTVTITDEPDLSQRRKTRAGE